MGPCVIGIVGGVASGKSTVARMMRSLGAHVIDADRIGHELLDEREVRKELVAAWGEKILDPEGRIDRGKLGKIVFDDAAALATLNRIVRPRIVEEVKQKLSALRKDPRLRAAVLDAALLVEAGLGQLCDRLLYVETSCDRRRERAKWQRGWDEAEIDRREKAQASLAEKRSRADYVVCNDGTEEQTLLSVRKFWDEFIEPMV